MVSTVATALPPGRTSGPRRGAGRGGAGGQRQACGQGGGQADGRCGGVASSRIGGAQGFAAGSVARVRQRGIAARPSRPRSSAQHLALRRCLRRPSGWQIALVLLQVLAGDLRRRIAAQSWWFMLQAAALSRRRAVADPQRQAAQNSPLRFNAHPHGHRPLHGCRRSRTRCCRCRDSPPPRWSQCMSSPVPPRRSSRPSWPNRACTGNAADQPPTAGLARATSMTSKALGRRVPTGPPARSGSGGWNRGSPAPWLRASPRK